MLREPSFFGMFGQMLKSPLRDDDATGCLYEP
jgi:hypothetical protein